MNHTTFLKEALYEARKAQANGQNPIGCIIVDGDGKILVSNRLIAF